MSRHIRPSVAKWFRDVSLGARLSFFVAVIVFGVVTSVAYLEVRSYEGHIDRDLVDAAGLAARSAADALAQRALPIDPLDIRDSLHDLVDADPVLDAISVIEADPTGHLHVFTSTSTEERAEVLELAGRAITTKAPASDRSSTAFTVALPVPRRGNYAVAATVGLESLLQARAHEFRVALGFAVPTIVLVTLLVNLTVRQLVGQPLNAILRVMSETAEGNLHARTTITRRDELGTIATRLNEMLDQLERFNQSLHDRIEEATSDLSTRNAQLAASQNELFTLRESLSRAERVAALGQVAANVAHQAGTPLNLVSGYVQMIRDDPRTDDRTRARLQTVDTQIQQVTRVLRTMLDHARQPSGFEIMALGDVLERVRELAQPRLSRSNIRLEMSVAEHLPHISADATRLEMALLNLVTNALDAMPAGGRLSITAAERPEGIRVTIADTGAGIPAEIMDHLFDPWVTSKPTGQGSGLGLAIVRDVVQAHGGSISASSRPTGAVFVIDLPAAPSPRTSA
jgi:two-component system, NtrC family, sensor kinase